MTAREAVISIQTQLNTSQSDTDIVNNVQRVLQEYYNSILDSYKEENDSLWDADERREAGTPR